MNFLFIFLLVHFARTVLIEASTMTTSSNDRNAYYHSTATNPITFPVSLRIADLYRESSVDPIVVFDDAFDVITFTSNGYYGLGDQSAIPESTCRFNEPEISPPKVAGFFVDMDLSLRPDTEVYFYLTNNPDSVLKNYLSKGLSGFTPFNPAYAAVITYLNAAVAGDPTSRLRFQEILMWDPNNSHYNDKSVLLLNFEEMTINDYDHAACMNAYIGVFNGDEEWYYEYNGVNKMCCEPTIQRLAFNLLNNFTIDENNDQTADTNQNGRHAYLVNPTKPNPCDLVDDAVKFRDCYNNNDKKKIIVIDDIVFPGPAVWGPDTMTREKDFNIYSLDGTQTIDLSNDVLHFTGRNQSIFKLQSITVSNGELRANTGIERMLIDTIVSTNFIINVKFADIYTIYPRLQILNGFGSPALNQVSFGTIEFFGDIITGNTGILCDAGEITITEVLMGVADGTGIIIGGTAGIVDLDIATLTMTVMGGIGVQVDKDFTGEIGSVKNTLSVADGMGFVVNAGSANIGETEFTAVVNGAGIYVETSATVAMTGPMIATVTSGECVDNRGSFTINVVAGSTISVAGGVGITNSGSATIAYVQFDLSGSTIGISSSFHLVASNVNFPVIPTVAVGIGISGTQAGIPSTIDSVTFAAVEDSGIGIEINYADALVNIQSTSVSATASNVESGGIGVYVMTARVVSIQFEFGVIAGAGIVAGSAQILNVDSLVCADIQTGAVGMDVLAADGVFVRYVDIVVNGGYGITVTVDKVTSTRFEAYAIPNARRTANVVTVNSGFGFSFETGASHINILQSLGIVVTGVGEGVGVYVQPSSILTITNGFSLSNQGVDVGVWNLGGSITVNGSPRPTFEVTAGTGIIQDSGSLDVNGAVFSAVSTGAGIVVNGATSATVDNTVFQSISSGSGIISYIDINIGVDALCSFTTSGSGIGVNFLGGAILNIGSTTEISTFVSSGDSTGVFVNNLDADVTIHGSFSSSDNAVGFDMVSVNTVVIGTGSSFGHVGSGIDINCGVINYVVSGEVGFIILSGSPWVRDTCVIKGVEFGGTGVYVAEPSGVAIIDQISFDDLATSGMISIDGTGVLVGDGSPSFRSLVCHDPEGCVFSGTSVGFYVSNGSPYIDGFVCTQNSAYLIANPTNYFCSITGIGILFADTASMLYVGSTGHNQLSILSGGVGIDANVGDIDVDDVDFDIISDTSTGISLAPGVGGNIGSTIFCNFGNVDGVGIENYGICNVGTQDNTFDVITGVGIANFNTLGIINGIFTIDEGVGISSGDTGSIPGVIMQVTGVQFNPISKSNAFGIHVVSGSTNEIYDTQFLSIAEGTGVLVEGASTQLSVASGANYGIRFDLITSGNGIHVLNGDALTLTYLEFADIQGGNGVHVDNCVTTVVDNYVYSDISGGNGALVNGGATVSFANGLYTLIQGGIGVNVDVPDDQTTVNLELFQIDSITSGHGVKTSQGVIHIGASDSDSFVTSISGGWGFYFDTPDGVSFDGVEISSIDTSAVGIENLGDSVLTVGELRACTFLNIEGSGIINIGSLTLHEKFLAGFQVLSGNGIENSGSAFIETADFYVDGGTGVVNTGTLSVGDTITNFYVATGFGIQNTGHCTLFGSTVFDVDEFGVGIENSDPDSVLDVDDARFTSIEGVGIHILEGVQNTIDNTFFIDIAVGGIGVEIEGVDTIVEIGSSGACTGGLIAGTGVYVRNSNTVDVNGFMFTTVSGVGIQVDDSNLVTIDLVLFSTITGKGMFITGGTQIDIGKDVQCVANLIEGVDARGIHVVGGTTINIFDFDVVDIVSEAKGVLGDGLVTINVGTPVVSTFNLVKVTNGVGYEWLNGVVATMNGVFITDVIGDSVGVYIDKLSTATVGEFTACQFYNIEGIGIENIGALIVHGNTNSLFEVTTGLGISNIGEATVNLATFTIGSGTGIKSFGASPDLFLDVDLVTFNQLSVASAIGIEILSGLENTIDDVTFVGIDLATGIKIHDGVDTLVDIGKSSSEHGVLFSDITSGNGVHVIEGNLINMDYLIFTDISGGNGVYVEGGNEITIDEALYTLIQGGIGLNVIVPDDQTTVNLQQFEITSITSDYGVKTSGGIIHIGTSTSTSVVSSISDGWGFYFDSPDGVTFDGVNITSIESPAVGIENLVDSVLVVGELNICWFKNIEGSGIINKGTLTLHENFMAYFRVLAGIGIDNSGTANIESTDFDVETGTGVMNTGTLTIGDTDNTFTVLGGYGIQNTGSCTIFGTTVFDYIASGAYGVFNSDPSSVLDVDSALFSLIDGVGIHIVDGVLNTIDDTEFTQINVGGIGIEIEGADTVVKIGTNVVCVGGLILGTGVYVHDSTLVDIDAFTFDTVSGIGIQVDDSDLVTIDGVLFLTTITGKGMYITGGTQIDIGEDSQCVATLIDGPSARGIHIVGGTTINIFDFDIVDIVDEAKGVLGDGSIEINVGTPVVSTFNLVKVTNGNGYEFLNGVTGKMDAVFITDVLGDSIGVHIDKLSTVTVGMSDACQFYNIEGIGIENIGTLIVHGNTNTLFEVTTGLGISNTGEATINLATFTIGSGTGIKSFGASVDLLLDVDLVTFNQLSVASAIGIEILSGLENTIDDVTFVGIDLATGIKIHDGVDTLVDIGKSSTQHGVLFSDITSGNGVHVIEGNLINMDYLKFTDISGGNGVFVEGGTEITIDEALYTLIQGGIGLNVVVPDDQTTVKFQQFQIDSITSGYGVKTSQGIIHIGTSTSTSVVSSISDGWGFYFDSPDGVSFDGVTISSIEEPAVGIENLVDSVLVVGELNICWFMNIEGSGIINKGTLTIHENFLANFRVLSGVGIDNSGTAVMENTDVDVASGTGVLNSGIMTMGPVSNTLTVLGGYGVQNTGSLTVLGDTEYDYIGDGAVGIENSDPSSVLDVDGVLFTEIDGIGIQILEGVSNTIDDTDFTLINVGGIGIEIKGALTQVEIGTNVRCTATTVDGTGVYIHDSTLVNIDAFSFDVVSGIGIRVDASSAVTIDGVLFVTTITGKGMFITGGDLIIIGEDAECSATLIDGTDARGIHIIGGTTIVIFDFDIVDIVNEAKGVLGDGSVTINVGPPVVSTFNLVKVTNGVGYEFLNGVVATMDAVFITDVLGDSVGVYIDDSSFVTVGEFNPCQFFNIEGIGIDNLGELTIHELTNTFFEVTIGLGISNTGKATVNWADFTIGSGTGIKSFGASADLFLDVDLVTFNHLGVASAIGIEILSGLENTIDDVTFVGIDLATGIKIHDGVDTLVDIGKSWTHHGVLFSDITSGNGIHVIEGNLINMDYLMFYSISGGNGVFVEGGTEITIDEALYTLIQGGIGLNVVVPDDQTTVNLQQFQIDSILAGYGVKTSGGIIHIGTSTSSSAVSWIYDGWGFYFDSPDGVTFDGVQISTIESPAVGIENLVDSVLVVGELNDCWFGGIDGSGIVNKGMLTLHENFMAYFRVLAGFGIDNSGTAVIENTDFDVETGTGVMNTGTLTIGDIYNTFTVFGGFGIQNTGSCTIFGATVFDFIASGAYGVYNSDPSSLLDVDSAVFSQIDGVGIHIVDGVLNTIDDTEFTQINVGGIGIEIDGAGTEVKIGTNVVCVGDLVLGTGVWIRDSALVDIDAFTFDYVMGIGIQVDYSDLVTIDGVLFLTTITGKGMFITGGTQIDIGEDIQCVATLIDGSDARGIHVVGGTTINIFDFDVVDIVSEAKGVLGDGSVVINVGTPVVSTFNLVKVTNGNGYEWLNGVVATMNGVFITDVIGDSVGVYIDLSSSATVGEFIACQFENIEGIGIENVGELIVHELTNSLFEVTTGLGISNTGKATVNWAEFTIESGTGIKSFGASLDLLLDVDLVTFNQLSVASAIGIEILSGLENTIDDVTFVGIDLATGIKIHDGVDTLVDVGKSGSGVLFSDITSGNGVHVIEGNLINMDYLIFTDISGGNGVFVEGGTEITIDETLYTLIQGGIGLNVVVPDDQTTVNLQQFQIDSITSGYGVKTSGGIIHIGTSTSTSVVSLISDDWGFFFESPDGVSFDGVTISSIESLAVGIENSVDSVLTVGALQSCSFLGIDGVGIENSGILAISDAFTTYFVLLSGVGVRNTGEGTILGSSFDFTNSLNSTVGIVSTGTLDVDGISVSSILLGVGIRVDDGTSTLTNFVFPEIGESAFGVLVTGGDLVTIDSVDVVIVDGIGFMFEGTVTTLVNVVDCEFGDPSNLVEGVGIYNLLAEVTVTSSTFVVGQGTGVQNDDGILHVIDSHFTSISGIGVHLFGGLIGVDGTVFVDSNSSSCVLIEGDGAVVLIGTQSVCSFEVFDGKGVHILGGQSTDITGIFNIISTGDGVYVDAVSHDVTILNSMFDGSDGVGINIIVVNTIHVLNGNSFQGQIVHIDCGEFAAIDGGEIGFVIESGSPTVINLCVYSTVSDGGIGLLIDEGVSANSVVIQDGIQFESILGVGVQIRDGNLILPLFNCLDITGKGVQVLGGDVEVDRGYFGVHDSGVGIEVKPKLVVTLNTHHSVFVVGSGFAFVLVRSVPTRREVPEGSEAIIVIFQNVITLLASGNCFGMEYYQPDTNVQMFNNTVSREGFGLVFELDGGIYLFNATANFIDLTPIDETASYKIYSVMHDQTYHGRVLLVNNIITMNVVDGNGYEILTLFDMSGSAEYSFYHNDYICNTEAPDETRSIWGDLYVLKQSHSSFEFVNNLIYGCVSTLLTHVRYEEGVTCSGGSCLVAYNFNNDFGGLVASNVPFLGVNFVKQFFMETGFTPNSPLPSDEIHTPEVDFYFKFRDPDDDGHTAGAVIFEITCEDPVDIDRCLHGNWTLLRDACSCVCELGWTGEWCDCNQDNPICSRPVQWEDFIVPFAQDIRHKFKNGLLEGTYREDDERRDVDAPEGKVLTGRSTCINEYIGVLIDADYQLWIWGESIENDYLESDTKLLQKVDTSSWLGIPRFLRCTRTSVFILTHTGNMYFMGKNFDNELESGHKESTFVLSRMTDIFYIETSVHSLYVLKKDYTIYAIGMNHYGCLGVDSTDEFIDDYLPVIQHNFPVRKNTYPVMKAMEHGVLFTFYTEIENVNLLFYAGRDHPSLATPVTVIPKRIDFTDTVYSELSNLEHVNYVDRIIGGKMYIVTENKIFISGERKWDDGPGITNDAVVPVPYEIDDYGDYNGDRIYRFLCSYTCYIMTTENLYVVGKTNDGIGLGAECENDDCKRITLANDYTNLIIPGLGRYYVNHETKDQVESYDYYHVEKPEVFNTFADNEPYRYPPSIVFSESKLEDDVLTLKIVKPEVFGEMDSVINFHSEITNENFTMSQSCNFPKIGVTKWHVWNVLEEDGSANDYYYFSLPWGEFREQCGWIREDQDDLVEYRNSLNFTEVFYLGIRHGRFELKTEHFFFDLTVRFKKIVLSSEIFSVQQDEFSEYWDAYIYNKDFDRDTRRGRIEFATITRSPNYFVFIDEIDSDKSRLGPITPNVPEYVIERTVEVYEIGEFVCNDKNCYQNYGMTFEIIDDYRVCRVPMTTFPIHWHSRCDTSQTSQVECVSPTRNVDWKIMMSIENLCGGELVQTIETEYTLQIFTDWTYQEVVDTETFVYEVGDWIYALATVKCDIVTIENTQIERLIFQDNTRNQELMIPNPDFDGVENAINTQMGDTIKLVNDYPEPVTQVGFHFRLSNELLYLQPGEKGTYTLILYLKLTYTGNEAPVVTGRRATAVGSFGHAFVEKSLDIVVHSSAASQRVLPYIAGVAALVIVTFCLGCLAMAGIIFFVRRRKQKELDKEKVVYGVGGDEKEDKLSNMATVSVDGVEIAISPKMGGEVKKSVEPEKEEAPKKLVKKVRFDLPEESDGSYTYTYTDASSAEYESGESEGEYTTEEESEGEYTTEEESDGEYETEDSEEEEEGNPPSSVVAPLNLGKKNQYGPQFAWHRDEK